MGTRPQSRQEYLIKIYTHTPLEITWPNVLANSWCYTLFLCLLLLLLFFCWAFHLTASRLDDFKKINPISLSITSVHFISLFFALVVDAPWVLLTPPQFWHWKIFFSKNMREKAKGKHQYVHIFLCFSVTKLIHICTADQQTASLIRQEPGSPISEFGNYYRNTCIQNQNR